MKKSLRLTGGSYTGRRLYVPKTGTRPATNRVREAIFNVVNNYFDQGVKGLAVLDLFAGCGSLGLEALSRGAATCTFIDNDPNAVRSIRKNIGLLNLKGEVISSTVHAYLKAKRRLRYELVFMDPPYRYTGCGEVIRLLRVAIDGKLSPILIYERFYEEMCQARLQPVLDSIRLMKKLNIWVEITTLVIPGQNDSERELIDIARFIAGVDPEIPWHISRFHPDYKYTDTHGTPIDTLRKAYSIGKKEGLVYIYIGNVLGESEDTICPGCRKSLIKRTGFFTGQNKIADGRCPSCGRAIAGIF